MSTTAGDIPVYDMRAARPDRAEVEFSIPIVAAGAVGAVLNYQDDPNITVTHGTAGVYSLTFPPSADIRGTIDCTLVSAAGTVKGFYWSAFAPNAGTAQITTTNAAGAATDPANGDSLIIALTLSRTKQF